MNKIKGKKKRKENTTTKKVKVVGTEQYINQSTGELKEMQVINIEERDFNFRKIWLQALINSMDLIGNQKTRLAFWIVDHLDNDNRLIMTQREISEKSGISIDTVRRTMTTLQDSNFLQKKHSGVYIVNPNVIFKGGYNKRMCILTEYIDTENEKREQEVKNNENNEKKANTD